MSARFRLPRILAFLLLAACTGVNYGADLNLGPGGMTFSPSVSGSAGNARLIVGN
jgi:hypothetical protein